MKAEEDEFEQQQLRLCAPVARQERGEGELLLLLLKRAFHLGRRFKLPNLKYGVEVRGGKKIIMVMFLTCTGNFIKR